MSCPLSHLVLVHGDTQQSFLGSFTEELGQPGPTHHSRGGWAHRENQKVQKRVERGPCLLLCPKSFLLRSFLASLPWVPMGTAAQGLS